MLSMLLGFEMQTRQPPVITLVGHRGNEGGGEWPIKCVGSEQVTMDTFSSIHV